MTKIIIANEDAAAAIIKSKILDNRCKDVVFASSYESNLSLKSTLSLP